MPLAPDAPGAAGYVVYDTQLIVERAHAGEFDVVRHAMDLFVSVLFGGGGGGGAGAGAGAGLAWPAGQSHLLVLVWRIAPCLSSACWGAQLGRGRIPPPPPEASAAGGHVQVDFFAIFVRLLIILLKNAEKREQEDRRRSNKRR